MRVKIGQFSKEDLCLFLNESMAKIIQNIEARNGKLKSFDLNFNFEKSKCTLTERDIGAFRTRIKE